MAAKPGDFSLGVIEFLAVLVPGLVLLMLQGTVLGKVYPLEWTIGKLGWWFPFLVAGYVLGQLLFASSEWFVDDIYYRRRRNKKFELPVSDYYKQLAESEADLLSKSEDETAPRKRTELEKRKMLFHRAFSRIRLKDGEVLTEVERSAANFKLLRSLVLVFALDSVISLIPEHATLESFFSVERIRFVASGALAVASYIRFEQLKKWTEGLVFEFAVLISDDGCDDSA